MTRIDTEVLGKGPQWLQASRKNLQHKEAKIKGLSTPRRTFTSEVGRRPCQRHANNYQRCVACRPQSWKHAAQFLSSQMVEFWNFEGQDLLLPSSTHPAWLWVPQEEEGNILWGTLIKNQTSCDRIKTFNMPGLHVPLYVLEMWKRVFTPWVFGAGVAASLILRWCHFFFTKNFI